MRARWERADQRGSAHLETPAVQPATPAERRTAAALSNSVLDKSPSRRGGWGFLFMGRMRRGTREVAVAIDLEQDRCHGENERPEDNSLRAINLDAPQQGKK